MGLMKVRGELEDLAFRVLDPEMFLKCKRTQTAANIAFIQANEDIEELLNNDEILKQHNVKVKLTHRIKDKYQIYLKMKRKNLESVNDVHDALGFRLILDVPNKWEEAHSKYEQRCHMICYHLIDRIKSLRRWKSRENGFKDYIKDSKDNGYQSLHQYLTNKALGTTIEVQIRTRQMHMKAEVGQAAHWSYKDMVYRAEIANTKSYQRTWRSPEQMRAESFSEVIGTISPWLSTSAV
jgi:GTP pyrophosphokinase